MARLQQIINILCLIFVICSTEDLSAVGLPNNTSVNAQIPYETPDYDLEYELLDSKFNIVPENFFHKASDKIDLQKNSTKCDRDIDFTLNNLNKPWALQMLDAFGKPESGILLGNTRWIGEYIECLDVYAPPSNESDAGNFHGQYCAMDLPLRNISISIRLGICAPDSCPASYLQASYGPNGSLVTCQPKERHLSGGGVIVILLLSIFCTLVVLGSTVTVVKHFMEMQEDSPKSDSTTMQQTDENADNVPHNKEETASKTFNGFLVKYGPFLQCFCVFKNGAKLLNTDTREGELLCIHGIRFLSISWVIMGHAYEPFIPGTRNILQELELIKNWPFQVILQSYYAVDTFFILSGFLLTYLSMLELDKKKSINWPYFYIHRYLRLTPMYMMFLGFFAAVLPYLGSGPFWYDDSDNPTGCKYVWWKNLLYINNFFDTTCANWTWYLANDMQFFVISPIILVTLWKWPYVGIAVLQLLLAICWLCNFLLTYFNDLAAGPSGFLLIPGTDFQGKLAKNADYFRKIYYKPYTRIAPYLIGMLTGYVLYLRKKKNAPKHSLVTLTLGWIIATTITLASVYGLYHQNPGLAGRSFYNAFSCTTWAVGVCWVIYVCLSDQGGFVNRILSYKLFIPLSRLTYAVYLIHPLIYVGYYASIKTTLQFSHFSKVLLFMGAMIASYVLALPVSLVLESPLVGLEKMVRTKLSKKN